MKYLSLFSCFFFYILTSSVQADVVPTSKTFKLVNRGPISSTKAVELGAKYRVLNVPNTNKSNPFSLCFYTIPPSNTFMLGIGVGRPQFDTVFRWVWTANATKHVKENATLVFGGNGNLVLADSDGRVAWQTGTANKGVVDIKLLPNGNLVLLDRKGAYVWQSFHYATDTLLIGQTLSLSKGSSNKLVNGAYSMVLEKHLINLYYKSPLSSKPVAYYGVTPGYMEGLQNATFQATHWSDGSNHLVFQYEPNGGQSGWAEPKYNAVLSLFRLGSDGNLRIFSYDKSRQSDSWDVTFTRFSNAWRYASECMLPEKCGSLGICENNKCVSCPTPNGLKSWTKDCKPSKLPACPTNKNGTANTYVSYYKLEGVDHFMANSEVNKGEGPMKMEACKKKCSDDCKCVAFFYRKDSSKCLLTAQLNTLNKVMDSSNSLSVLRLLVPHCMGTLRSCS
ncbi:hypothetical protein MKW94_020643 [Papaver nudicaule]|uniref:Bulb-type lectin domain-containing protein n=1 Tax=Papaver nudicaule TaxID=74823 RepID=A0AA41VF95_PAPNU|nr:hypothetical protein [Papaver nudicaule]